MSFLTSEGAAPSTPATGKVVIYAKTDGLVYSKGDDGIEYNLTGATLGTYTASTSGTTVNFTGIPSGVKRITLNFVGVSSNGTANWFIRIGSGSLQATGYLGAANRLAASTSAESLFTTSFGIMAAAAAYVLHGTATLTLVDAATNTWVCTHTLSNSNTAVVFSGAGSVSLSGAVDRISLLTANGTDTFDAGALNITYE